MKKICLLLILSMILIIGCGDNSSSKSNETNSAKETVEAETEIFKYVAAYLPDKTYGGYEFRFVVPEDGLYDIVTTAVVEEETGDTINDAIYQRNRVIEEKYDIVFKQISVPDYPVLKENFRKSVASASDDFDLGMMISRDAWEIALTGAVVPVNKLPYLDISQPWYSQDVNSEISINGKLYFAYSDECVNMFEQTMCVLFNKKLVDDLSLGNLYDLVTDNKWTVDKFFDLARPAAADLDGDGTMTDTDRYGILMHTDLFYPCFWVSSGVKTVSKDADDLLIFTGQSEKLFTILEKVYQNVYGSGQKIHFDIWRDKITSYPYVPGTEDQRKVSNLQFQDNKGLFLVHCIGVVSTLRAMEADFGILPFPKYDEAQAKYYSRVADGWLHCVPVTNSDLERTSIIMESLAVESKNITVPAYMETALRTKFTRDDDSAEMLDIIHADRTMDLGDVFYMFLVRAIYTDILGGASNKFASAVESRLNAINKEFDKANEIALALE